MQCARFVLSLSWCFAFGLPAIAQEAEKGLILRPVNETFVGDNYVSILPLLGLGSEDAGRTIAYVVLRGHSENGRGTAAVSVDGEDITPTQAVGTTTQDYTFPLPASANLASDDGESLQFHLRGRFSLESVGLQWEAPQRPSPTPAPVPTPTPAPPAPTPPVPTQPYPQRPRNLHPVVVVRQPIQGLQRLELARFLNISAYEGLQLRSFTLHAGNRFGRTSDATLCTNQCSTLFVGGLGPYFFPTPDAFVNQASDHWSLYLNDGLWLEAIEFDFSP